MAWLDTGPALKEYSARMLFQIFKRIEDAINFLDENNFKNKVNGSIIAAGTLHGSALQDRTLDGGAKLADLSTPLKKLQWAEFEFFPVAAVPVATTTSTTDVNVGPYFAWDPNKFPGGSWYLEASIAVSDGAGKAIVTLKSEAVIGSVETSQTALTRVRSTAPLAMPATAQNIWFAVRTDNSAYMASFAGAKLIYVP
jgi:hypothetical protein